MPKYTIQAPDGRKITIEAKDQATAMRGAQEWAAANPKGGDREASGGIAGLITGKTRTKVDPVTGFMSNLNRGLLIGDELQAGFETAADAVQGKVPNGKTLDYLKNLGSAYQRNLGKVRGFEDSFSESNPNVAALARGTGNAATALVPGGPLMQTATRGTNIARGAVAAAMMGSGAALADRGSFSDRLSAAGNLGNIALNAALGGGAGALAPALRRAPQQVPPDVATLNRAGVQMTPGQMRGGLAKAFEDAGTSLPILGPKIQEARRSGVESFNAERLNNALSNIDDALPDGMVGQEAVRYTGDRLSAALDNVAPSGSISIPENALIPEGLVGDNSRRFGLDDELAGEIREGLQGVSTMTDGARRRLDSILSSRLTSRVEGGSISPENYRLAQSELAFEARQFKGSQDPDQQRIGNALEAVRTALRGLAERQDPKFASSLAAANRGWAELVTIENAAAKATDGVFTPTQYDVSVRQGDPRVRKRGYARGEARGQDISTAARNVLPSSIGDSGTAMRNMVGALASAPGVIAGAGLGGAPGAAMGYGATLTGLGIASRAYTPRAIEVANRALTARVTAQEQQALLAELRNLAMQSPANQELYRQVVSRVPAAIGASTATNSAPSSLSSAAIR